MLSVAKPSAFVRQMEAQAKRLCDLQRRFTIQQMEDMAIIAFGALYEACHDGEEPSQALAILFRDQLRVTLMAYAEVALDDDAKDGNNDPRLNYTKGTIDNVLKRLLGEEFVPWEERYTMGTNL